MYYAATCYGFSQGPNTRTRLLDNGPWWTNFVDEPWSRVRCLSSPEADAMSFTAGLGFALVLLTADRCSFTFRVARALSQTVTEGIGFIAVAFLIFPHVTHLGPSCQRQVVTANPVTGTPQISVTNRSIGLGWWDLCFGNMVFLGTCLLYTSPSPRDLSTSRMPSSA